MQALTHRALKAAPFPAVWATGPAYLINNFWQRQPNASLFRATVANAHVPVAYSVAAFIVVHVDLLAIGHFAEHVKPMVAGVNQVDLTPEEEAYLKADEPGRLRR